MNKFDIIRWLKKGFLYTTSLVIINWGVYYLLTLIGFDMRTASISPLVFILLMGLWVVVSTIISGVLIEFFDRNISK